MRKSEERVLEDIRIMNYVEKYAAISPDAPAIVDTEGQSITYAQLNQTVIALSQFIISQGIKLNQRIAVVISTGVEMAIAYFAVSNVASFVPLSSDFSEEQYRYYFEILKTDTLIIQQDYKGPLIHLAEELDMKIFFLHKHENDGDIKYKLSGGLEQRAYYQVILAKNEDIAVVNYTSGTTAKPKIVPKSHINDYTYPFPFFEYLSLTDKDRLLIMTPMCRHISLDMLLSTLASGGCAICVDNFKPEIFFRLIDEFSPTWFFASPVVFQTIVDQAENNIQGLKSALRFTLSLGAPLTDKLAKKIKSLFNIPVYDAYGSTETGWIACTAYEPKGCKEGSVGVPLVIDIGIMDEKGQLVGKNNTGEIVARGPQVINGYDDDDENININSFYGDWFRTGDSGYFDDDGYLFITGRIKELINRGGEKISPYEVEEAIAKHPNVLQNVVFPIPGMEGNEDVGTAIVLREGKSLYLKDLRRFLNGKITAFKMPTSLYILEEIPSSSANKVQRNTLFANINSLGIDAQPESDKNEKLIMPRNETEIKLAVIFRKILPVTDISIMDTFFELGGDSLKAAVLYDRIQKYFQIQIPLTYIFKNGSIKNLAEYIQNNKENKALYPFVVPFQENGSKTPIFFVHAEEGEAVIFRHIANDFDSARPFYAFSFNPEAAKWLHPLTFKQIARHYIKDIRSIQPEGPYILAGQCVGGIIAYEMAQQLLEENQEISLIAMYDALVPDANNHDNLKNKLLRNINEIIDYGFKGFLNYLSIKIHYYKIRFLKIMYKKLPACCKIFIFRLMNKRSLISFARSNYILKPYDGKIVFFKPENNSSNASDLSINVWLKLLRDFTVITLRGNHKSVFYEENAENTREVLEKILADIP